MPSNANTTAFIEMEDGITKYGLAVGLTFIYPTIIKAGFNAAYMLVRYLIKKNAKLLMKHYLLFKKIFPIASQQTILNSC